MNGQQLKNSILQLAIQGKLVPQDPNDEPASVLLGKIRKEKEQLVKAGKLKKKDLDSTPIADEEKPFEIPESWEWVRISDIFVTTSGSTPLSSNPLYYNGNINWTRTTDLNDSLLTSCEKQITQKAVEDYRLTIIPQDSVCIAMYGGAGTIGKNSLIKFNTTINQSVCAILPNGNTNMHYVQYFMHYHRPSWMEFAAGSRKDPNINQIIIKNCLFPLPPLSEQRRIVSKIEELMPFVSEYDKAKSKLDELNDRLPDALKKSILQEAIMGKLVPQDPNDEPASALLSKIRKEKEQLVKAGKLKKKDLVCTPIAEEEKPFEIPESWEWCRVFDICNFANPDKHKGKYVCLDAKFLRGKSKGNILEKGNYVEANSHIILVDGENSGEVFITPCCGYMGSTFKELIINSQPCEHYIRLFLLQLKEKLRNNKRGAAIPHLDKELFFQTLIPLPPLSEQHRIVSKIEELFNVLQ